MSSGTYDPAKVLVVFVAVPVLLAPVEGFADGTFITARFHKPDRFMLKHGLRGQVTRVFQPNRSGRIEFQLEQGAPQNALLSTAFATDNVLKLGVGLMGIKDRNSLFDLVGAAKCWIVGNPNWERRVVSGTVHWRFDCETLRIFHAGIKQDSAPSSPPAGFTGSDFT